MPYVIIQGGYASGDMFGIAATLILDNHARVLLVEPPSGSTKPNHAASIKTFYEQSGIDPGRIEILPNGSNRDAAIKRLLGLRPRDWYDRATDTRDLKHGTNYVAAKGASWVSGGYAKRVRNAWRLPDTVSTPAPYDMFIRAWLLNLGDRLHGGSRIVVLWSRYSGKKGDIHIEHDTGKTGMSQLVQRALSGNDYVFIAGDKPPFLRQKGRWIDLANAHPMRVFDITEFWSNQTPHLATWCQDRVDQLKLYDFLARHSVALKHLGFRSGNLEALALIGHTVRYLEERYSEGSSRMEAWHDSQIGYERLLLNDKVPTRSGQHVKAQIATNRRKLNWDTLRPGIVQPDWAPGKRATTLAVKPFLKSAYTPGFTDRDLKDIEEFLNS